MTPAAAPVTADPPHDLDLVRSAIRLGWYVAEVRGRNRPGAPPSAAPALPARVSEPLPLRNERSATERRIEAQGILTALAAKLGVNGPHGQRGFGEDIDDKATALWSARRASPPQPGQADAAWDDLARAVWELDAHVQDTLAASSDTQACGYELGRGLAESYWALDPDARSGWDSWEFLFDAARCAELTRLLGRLSGYLDPFSGPAIAGSLEVWRLVANDELWRRQPTVHADLHRQMRTWYELVVLGQDPTRLINPYHLIRNWRVTAKAAWTYLPQLLLGAAGVGALFAFVFVLSAEHPAHWEEALTGVLSAAGLSSAGLTAKLKNEAQALSTRLRQDAYTDLVAVSITTAPAPPHPRHGRTRRAALERAVRRRTLTPSTPLR